jgi:hypothetical protein
MDVKSQLFTIFAVCILIVIGTFIVVYVNSDSEKIIQVYWKSVLIPLVIAVVLLFIEFSSNIPEEKKSIIVFAPRDKVRELLMELSRGGSLHTKGLNFRDRYSNVKHFFSAESRFGLRVSCSISDLNSK